MFSIIQFLYDFFEEGYVTSNLFCGVSNIFNITPQDSTLNRYGDMAYMEDVIRKAGGAIDFEAIITYPDTKTHMPSHFHSSSTHMRSKGMSLPNRSTT